MYWHAGFSVEHMLKAVLLLRQGLEEWPQGWRSGQWHRLDHVASQAGLGSAIQSMIGSGSALGANWLTVRDWDHQKRYPPMVVSEAEAKDLLLAVANPTRGIMKWLQDVYRSI